MKHMRLVTAILSLGFFGSSCSMIERAKDITDDTDRESIAAPGLKDGDLAVPQNYRQWPVFLADIDKVDAKQIRDIYISPAGSKTREGNAFPDGTISVMEIWNPAMTASGDLQRDANGKLVKSDLKAIYLMAKSTGAGEMVSENLRNGDWVYSAYQADGKTPVGGDAIACRACHTPQADKDWVHRYDEYFATRGS